MTFIEMKKTAQRIFDDYHRMINYEYINEGKDVEFGIDEQEYILKNKDRLVTLIFNELNKIRNWKIVKSIKLVKNGNVYSVEIEEIKKEKGVK